MAEACGSRTQTLDSQLTANDDVAASARFQLESIGVRTVQVPARFCLLHCGSLPCSLLGPRFSRRGIGYLCRRHAAQVPSFRAWVVGIELGRAGVQVEGYHPRPFGTRGGCTIPPWPRFPRPPDNPGRPNFSRSGLEPWPILHEPSQTPRGLSADSHTPHDSGLPTASFHLRRRLIPTLCPGIARMTKPPSVQSPFAPRPVLPARGRRVPTGHVVGAVLVTLGLPDD